tara:strand:- start:8791 stop:10125 length:1335 start_codon:yes stop_codon:yes gene_type:complete
MAVIRTDEQLETEIGKLASGQQGGVPQVTASTQDVSDATIQGTQDTMLGTAPVASTTVAVPENIRPDAPTATVGTGQLTQPQAAIQPQIGAMDTAQIAERTYVGDIQGAVSQGSIATAPTQELDEKATTRFQLKELLSSLDEGTDVPAWASPAVRKVTAIMQARGLGSSSMAAAAMTQAVLESGTVIATQDANKYATIQLQNLSGQQKVALQNALTYAAMDKANLSTRLQGAVTNAQSLLTVDVKNLDSQQKTNTINFNALTQALFKDSAEANARQQFNAKNQLQVDQFFSELEAQVETANANRVSALAQFNAGEANAQTQYNATLQDARDKFNANMQYAIDQSNVQWRRQVNTANTALQNETNRLNVQNLYNANQNALNNLWQKYRDNASWNFQKSESYLQRQHEIGIMAMEFANSKEIYDKQQKDNLAAGVGNWIAAWMGSS